MTSFFGVIDLLAILPFYLSSVGIYYFESEAQPEAFASVLHSLWWSVVTLTTVGYGDVVPVTIGGRIFTAVVLFIGIGIVAVPTGIMSSALVRIRELDVSPEEGAPSDGPSADQGGGAGSRRE